MFRFTTRELMLVTAIVAMGLTWGADRGRYMAEKMRYQNINTKLNAYLHHQGILLDRLDPHWRDFRGSIAEYAGQTPTAEKRR